MNDIIAGNKSINKTIHKCFDIIVDESIIEQFKKKFIEQREDNALVLNTFRELILGAYLAKNLVSLEYEPRINNQTPDWRVWDRDCSSFIVELYNIHPSNEIKKAINLSTPTMYWPPELPVKLNKMIEKIKKYKEICDDGLIFAMFPTIESAMEEDEFEDLWEKSKVRLPNYCVGLLLMQEMGIGGIYSFRFFKNINSVKSLSLPSMRL